MQQDFCTLYSTLLSCTFSNASSVLTAAVGDSSLSSSSVSLHLFQLLFSGLHKASPPTVLYQTEHAQCVAPPSPIRYSDYSCGQSKGGDDKVGADAIGRS